MISKPAQQDATGRPGIDPHSFRTPVPVERFHVSHPNVPDRASGLTILHVTDTHVRRDRDRYRDLCDVLGRIDVDLVLLTGDYMTHPGDEAVALRVLERMAERWRTRLGAFGVFGNHDSPAFQRAAGRLPGITWLSPGIHDLQEAGIRLLGTSWPEDWTDVALQDAARPDAGDCLRLGLVHSPAALPGAAAFGLDVILAGHTHGGQIRFHLPRLLSWAPHTSTDLHRHHPSGMLRLGQTLCCVSRGLGEQIIELRVQCPLQLPLYTLRRGPAPGRGDRARINRVVHW